MCKDEKPTMTSPPQDNQNDRTSQRPPPSTTTTSSLASPKTYLPLIVLIDMFAVAIVVPLMHQYYRMAGVSSAPQRELLSSLFSSSQIVGGLVIGALSDAKYLSGRNTLFLSFCGSALSYGLIMKGSLWAVVCSRVLVGAVKQTMTVSTALLAGCTSEEERATHMGRLKASATLAWVLGPSAGALLYKYVNPYAPAMVSCGLFVMLTVVASVIIPKDASVKESQPKPLSSSAGFGNRNNKSKFSSFTSNLRSCFTSTSLASVVTSTLVFSWVTRATSYASMTSYYEELYGIEPHQRGYLSSYQMVLRLLVQATLVRPILRYSGGERRAAVVAAVSLSLATLVETRASFTVFIFLINPVISVSVPLLELSLRTLVTVVAPKESLGSVLAALDVMQNAAAVTVPFYRTGLFKVLEVVGGVLGRGGGVDEDAVMKGDPDPFLWLVSSAVHWAIAAVLLWVLLLLLGSKGEGKEKEKIQ